MKTQYALPHSNSFTKNIDGKNTHLFTLKNRAGMQIALTDYGARLVSALVPDKNGNLIDVVLGFDSIDGYINAQEKYHGATIGRFANRISNGTFRIDDKEYKLPINNGPNCLHGGPNGFHTKVWDRQVNFRKNVDFYYVSPDNEEGFPGSLNTIVKYELTDNNEIIINFKATATQKTIVNLTNHAYFNLNGEGDENIYNHLIKINSEEFIEINDSQTPTGTKQNVKNTLFDFTKECSIGDRLNQTNDQLAKAQGYDHSFINNNTLSQMAASAFSPKTGIQLEVYTDYPTLHFYSSNFLSDDRGKSGKTYMKHGGFCFEAQHYIDNINQSNFPCIILEPGEEYNFNIIYRFSVKK